MAFGAIVSVIAAGFVANKVADIIADQVFGAPVREKQLALTQKQIAAEREGRDKLIAVLQGQEDRAIRREDLDREGGLNDEITALGLASIEGFAPEGEVSINEQLRGRDTGEPTGTEITSNAFTDLGARVAEAGAQNDAITPLMLLGVL